MLFSPQPLATTGARSVSGDLLNSGFRHVRPFVPGLFRATQCFQGSRPVSLVSLPRSSLWPMTFISWTGHCACLHSSVMGILAASSFWLWCLVVLGACVCICLSLGFQLFLYIHLSVELLNRVVIVSLAFEGAVKLFFHSG